MKINCYSQVKFCHSYSNARMKSVYAGFFPQDKKIQSGDLHDKNNDTINLALEKLSELNFSKSDIEKVARYGAVPVFKNGKEAIEFAKANSIPIIFGKVDQPDIHAQWVNDKNTIIINESYRFTKSPEIIYAISAAILHELGHAKDADGISSIQEEIDCLSLNALAFNEFNTLNINRIYFRFKSIYFFFFFFVFIYFIFCFFL